MWLQNRSVLMCSRFYPEFLSRSSFDNKMATQVNEDPWFPILRIQHQAVLTPNGSKCATLIRFWLKLYENFYFDLLNNECEYIFYKQQSIFIYGR